MFKNKTDGVVTISTWIRDCYIEYWRNYCSTKLLHCFMIATFHQLNAYVQIAQISSSPSKRLSRRLVKTEVKSSNKSTRVRGTPRKHFEIWSTWSRVNPARLDSFFLLTLAALENHEIFSELNIHEYLLNYSTLIMRRVLGSSAQRSTSLSRFIESVKSLSHPRVMKSLSLSCFIIERITVFMSFSFEKLRSLDADVMVCSGAGGPWPPEWRFFRGRQNSKGAPKLFKSVS